jgi:hypothetical protein
MLQEADHDSGYCPLLWREQVGAVSLTRLQIRLRKWENGSSWILLYSVPKYGNGSSELYYTHHGCIKARWNEKHILKANYYDAERSYRYEYRG